MQSIQKRVYLVSLGKLFNTYIYTHTKRVNALNNGCLGKLFNTQGKEEGERSAISENYLNLFAVTLQTNQPINKNLSSENFLRA